jgi:hypothetical protein
MPYYAFDRCDERVLPQLEEILDELNLVEKEAKQCRTWEPNNKSGGYGSIYVVTYEPHGQYHKLGLHTNDPDTDPAVIVILRRLIQICEPTQIFNGLMQPYHMSDFK